jgi:hypothetical protein
VEQPRNPLTLLIIGAVLGGILGAVVGIAIGSTAGRSSGGAGRVQTVVSTQTIRLGSLAPLVTTDTPTSDASTTAATTTDTTTTDTTTTALTGTTPATTDTTTTPTTTTATTTTDTTAAPPAPNDVPPPDRYNPPGGFCSTHVCGPGFSRGTGYAVECADGVWRKNGGTPSACRSDGGLA